MSKCWLGNISRRLGRRGLVLQRPLGLTKGITTAITAACDFLILQNAWSKVCYIRKFLKGFAEYYSVSSVCSSVLCLNYKGVAVMNFNDLCGNPRLAYL